MAWSGEVCGQDVTVGDFAPDGWRLLRRTHLRPGLSVVLWQPPQGDNRNGYHVDTEEFRYFDKRKGNCFHGRQQGSRTKDLQEAEQIYNEVLRKYNIDHGRASTNDPPSYGDSEEPKNPKPSIEEIRRKLKEIEEGGFNVAPFREKWKRLLFPPLLEMVDIPAGSFEMGGDKYGDEKPVHPVSLSAFKMAKYPVTFKRWSEVKEWGERNGYAFLNQGQQGAGSRTDENHPVTSISWYDAVLWCNALSEKEERKPCYYNPSNQTDVYRSGEKAINNECIDWEADGYRLPTEAEWEYACRAGTKTEYSVGDGINHNEANYDGKENGTTPAGKYGANKWGLHDMHGNVWEWCCDWYDSEYYKKSPKDNPMGPSWGSRRVLRGGSWYRGASYLRSANRRRYDPALAHAYYGFRPVCKAE